MLRFSGAREFVGFFGETDELGVFLEPFEGGVELFGLFDGAAPVFVRVDDEQGSGDLFDVGDGGALPVFFRFFQGRPPISSWEKRQPMSEVPKKLAQLLMERCVQAALKRSVWPTIQLVIKPP